MEIIKKIVTAQPWTEAGARFEDAKRFQTSQKKFIFRQAKPAIGKKAPAAEQLQKIFEFGLMRDKSG